MELMNKATQKKSKYVKSLITYKQKQGNDEEHDGDAEELDKTKSNAISSTEGNIGAGN
jgi:hypothetical protein